MSEDFVEQQASVIAYHEPVEAITAALGSIVGRFEGATGADRRALETARSILHRAYEMKMVKSAIEDALVASDV